MDALNTKIKSIKTEKTLKVRPENIKSGVSVFGITGTFEGNSDYAKFVEQDRSDNNLICYIYKLTLQNGALEDIEDIFENDNSIIATLLDIAESDFSSIENTLQNADINVLQDIITLCNITYELFLFREGEYYDVTRLHIESSSSESADIFNSTVDYGIYGIGFGIETDEQTGDSSVLVGEPYEFIDTSGTDATASDILNGKTAYVNGEYIEGTLVPLSPSGTISITQNGTVDVTNYANADVNIASFPPNWTELGYSNTPEMIIQGFNLAKDIKYNWDNTITSMNSQYYRNTTISFFPSVDTSNVTDMAYCFGSCTFLQSIGQIDTSKVTDMQNMFLSANKLVEVPQLNTSRVTKVYNMFNGCLNLSTTSLNNILAMAININPNYSGVKTLYEMGFRSNYYTTETWQSLPNYQAFLNAGWTMGF